MCDPLTIAGVALSGASTVVNSQAASRAARARSDALAAENRRQEQLQREANALNTQSQDRYENFEGQRTERSTELGDYFAAQKSDIGEANAASLLPRSSSNIVLTEEAKKRGQAADFTNNQAAALGELRSFGDLLGGISREQARDAGQIGQLGGFMRGSSSILPYELEAANQRSSGLRLFGDVLGGAGKISLNAGLSGGTMKNPFAKDR